MEVRFKKYCPWSYRITKGSLKKHLEDSLATVPEVEGLEMIRAGYAVAVENASPAERKVIEIVEHKIIAPKEVKVVEPKKAKALSDMDKDELEALGREHGIELDKRKGKRKLVKELEKAIGGNK